MEVAGFCVSSWLAVPGSSCKHTAALRRGGGKHDLTLAVSLERSFHQLSTSLTNTSQRGKNPEPTADNDLRPFCP